MQLKWDQGLASRGKLKGKKSFEEEGSQAAATSVPCRAVEVRWATDTVAPARTRRKRKRAETDDCVEDLQDRSVRPAQSCRNSKAITLASISPEIPVISSTPSAPVPKILFRDNNAQLFNHYLKHVAKVTVVTDTDKNPFKTIIMPMSFESPLIMSNILAIAAANISNTHPEYGMIAYSHLSDAYAELKDRLSNPETALSEITLAGVLGQVSYQLHHGDVSNWRVHLTAARGIVNALGGPKAVLANKPGYKFYIQHLAWLDTLAATTSSTKQIGKSDYWEALLSSISERKGSYSMKDLMGCPEELLEIIAEMTRRFDDDLFSSEVDLDGDLTAKIVEIVDETDPEKLQREQQVRNLLGAEYNAKLDALEPKSLPTDAASALSEVFRLAAKIYLTYRILHSTCWSSTIQDLLKTALGYLDMIPSKAQEEMALPWPLFIMGSVCVYAKEQKVIRTRYSGMTRYMGFGNIQRCVELLEEVWQGWHDAEVRSCPNRIAGQPWDERELGRKRWEDVMVEKGYDLLLA